MIPKTSSTSIQPILGTHGRGPIQVSACLLERPCPRHGALETSGRFSGKAPVYQCARLLGTDTKGISMLLIPCHYITSQH